MLVRTEDQEVPKGERNLLLYLQKDGEVNGDLPQTISRVDEMEQCFWSFG